jgi:voltage-dependent potassium channel beta subunit
MEYRSLGRSGLKVSALGLGGWTTFGGSVKDERVVKAVVRRAFEAGVNVYDLADVYAMGECERVMGRALAGLPRHELVVTTKLFWPMSDDVNDRGLSRKHVMHSIDRSLERLGTDHVDVYFCHRHDPETPVEETVRAMDDLVRRGKVLYWGTSEWTGGQIREAHAVARAGGFTPPRVEQPQYSLIARGKVERDVAPAAAELGMGLFPWSPLGSGLLTGKYDDGVPEGARLARVDWLREQVLTDVHRERVKAFREVADLLGVSRARLALAWVLRRPGVSSVLLGATSEAQFAENLGALEVAIPEDAARRLEAIFPSEPA